MACGRPRSGKVAFVSPRAQVDRPASGRSMVTSAPQMHQRRRGRGTPKRPSPPDQEAGTWPRKRAAHPRGDSGSSRQLPRQTAPEAPRRDEGPPKRKVPEASCGMEASGRMGPPEIVTCQSEPIGAGRIAHARRSRRRVARLVARNFEKILEVAEAPDLCRRRAKGKGKGKGRPDPKPGRQSWYLARSVGLSTSRPSPASRTIVTGSPSRSDSLRWRAKEPGP